MGSGKWIWFPGDYEIYHSLLLHGRRYERGAHIPCQWSLSTPYPNVSFTKEIELDQAAEFTCHATAPGVVTVMTGQFPRGTRVTVPTGTPVCVEPGKHRVSIQIQKIGGLPAAFIDSEFLWTDETWDASHATRAIAGKAACEPAYFNSTDNPEIFPFEYECWVPVETRVIPGGKLFDFGRETFAKLHIENANPAAAIRVQYGESEAETLDPNCVIVETVSGQSGYDFPAYAFRYVTLIAENAGGLTVGCDYEYLPLEDRAAFSCDVPEVKKVFDVCVHTFRLNCREFFLDGIKRDRWVWAGDAYQSALVNRYLFFDPAITRRTIRALLGKPPYEQHINCINDYSAYLIIMVWDYYAATGDAEFVKNVFPRVQALYDFIASRLDENGLVVGRPDDWVFVDWARFDREGPLCAEQILLWKVYDVMAKLSSLVGAAFHADPDALKQKIEALYWDAEKGSYIDGYVSGKKNVTRHANVFAILYGFAPEKAELIVQNVLLNDAVDPITTPYFKFFELMALCQIGNVEKAQEMILSYWYPMLELGATAIWEQFDPRETGVQHYSMYGDPYGRSLCHAWGAGPVCLLGRYVAGVETTSIADQTFDVAPLPGKYRKFDATVPVFGGTVRVECDADARTVKATATRGGGIGGWPWLSCWQGDLDLLGDPRPQNIYRRVMWGLDKGVHLYTTHPSRTGKPFYGMGWHWEDVKRAWTFGDEWLSKPVKLSAYADCDEVAFLINGREAARVKPEEYKAFAEIPYEKGTVEAVAYKNGAEIARDKIETTGAPAQIVLTPERAEIAADGMDLAFVRISLADAQDRPVTTVPVKVTAASVGGGILLAVGSGNPCTEENFCDTRETFDGIAMACVRAPKVPREISLSVHAEGLQPAQINIPAK